MILADTGGLYALIDSQDANHRRAVSWYRQVVKTEQLVLTQPILTESWWLVSARLGVFYADKLWSSVIDGVFSLIELGKDDLAVALEIETKYADAALGFVDATSMAACERNRISQVFTFDRTHFELYKPQFTKRLEPVPSGG